MVEPLSLPSPVVVVLVGPIASGKSAWAAGWFQPEQVVSSDALRAVVGEATHDLAASADAFDVLDDIVVRRLARRLTTVIDTLGFDRERRVRWRALAADADMPCVAVVFDTSASECRARNRARAEPVRPDVLTSQLSRWPAVRVEVAGEPWHDVIEPSPIALVPEAVLAPRSRSAPVEPSSAPAAPDANSVSATNGAMSFGVHLSSVEFPGGAPTLGVDLARIAGDADDAGIAHLWVMDHLRQIPQVGRPWEQMPEPFTTLAFLAARTTRVRLGTLVSPAFLRHPAVFAKSMATLDVLSGGRAICGLGVGWFREEYEALGIEFPTVAERYERLNDALELLPLMWGKGSQRYTGRAVSVAEAMCYPRPLQDPLPIWIGGSGERRTLRLVAEHAVGCNLFGAPEVVARRVEVVRRHCDEIGRDPAEIEISHLSTVLIGRDRAEVASLVDRLKPRRATTERFAASVNAGTIDDHVGRVDRFRSAGVQTMILRLADLATDGSVERLGGLVEAVSLR